MPTELAKAPPRELSVNQQISEKLNERLATIEQILPDACKGQAERLVKRALFYFATAKSDRLRKCTPASFVTCVVQAAEIGLPLDGRLGHAVPYGTEASFQPDYKGLVVLARRTGQIKDAYGDVVCENDHFKHGREGPESVLEHTYQIGQPRGKVIGAYCVIKFPGGDWRYEIMDADELDKIRKRSKASGAGPWVTDTDQMRIKTVLKRGLKLYCDDPSMVRALELDDAEYERPEAKPKVAKSDLMERLERPTAGNGLLEMAALETDDPVATEPERAAYDLRVDELQTYVGEASDLETLARIEKFYEDVPGISPDQLAFVRKEIKKRATQFAKGGAA